MTQLLQNALFGTALILAAVLLRRAMGERLLPAARLALWAVCLIRLLAPVFPASGLSLWGLAGAGTAGAAPDWNPAPLPNGGLGNVPAVNAPAGTAVPAPQPVEPAAFPWEGVVPAVWIGVGLVLAARYVWSWNRTRRAVAQAVPLGRDDPRYGLLPRCARLREGVMDGAPLTFGAARPTVVVPPELDGGALECVLVHEAVHARRRDNLWHYGMAAALIVYWWNPAVWLMSRLLRRDIELACDRAAVKRLGAARRAEYAQTLVALATASDGPAFCQTFGRKAAEERIISVMKFKKTTIFGVVLSLVLVAGVTAGFASAPKAPAGEGGRPNNTPYVVCANPLCTVGYQHCHIDGEVVRAYDEYPGLLCAHPDCDIEGPHEHDGTQYVGQAGKFVILNQDGGVVESAPPQKGPDSLIVYPGAPAEDVRAEYKALLVRLVSEGAATQAEADHLEASMEEYIAQVDSGALDELQFNPAGNGEVFAVAKGEPADTVTYHGRSYNRADLSAETLEWLDWYLALSEEEQLAVSYEPVELALALYYDTEDAGQPAGDEVPAGEQGLTHDPNGTKDSAGAGICTDESCPVSGEHHHEGDTVVYHYNTQPAGIPLCPVEGCTAWGTHTHDGATYLCSGAHCGGVCDGSCAAGVPSGGRHHGAGNGNGHHGNGHH